MSGLQSTKVCCVFLTQSLCMILVLPSLSGTLRSPSSATGLAQDTVGDMILVLQDDGNTMWMQDKPNPTSLADIGGENVTCNKSLSNDASMQALDNPKVVPLLVATVHAPPSNSATKDELKTKLLLELRGKNENCDKGHIDSVIENTAKAFEKVAPIVDGKITKEQFIEKFMDGDASGNKELVDRLFLSSKGDGLNFVDLATRLTKINLVPNEIDEFVKQDLKSKLSVELASDNPHINTSEIDMMIEELAEKFEKVASVIDGRVTKEQFIEKLMNGHKELADVIFSNSEGSGLNFVDLATRLLTVDLVPMGVEKLVKRDLKSKLLLELGGKNENCTRSRICSIIEQLADKFEKIAEVSSPIDSRLVRGKVTKDQFIDSFMKRDIGGNQHLVDAIFSISSDDTLNFADMATRLTQVNLVPDEIDEVVKQGLKVKLLRELGGKNENCDNSHIDSEVEMAAERFEKVASIVDGKVTKEQFMQKLMDGDVGGNQHLVDIIFFNRAGGLRFVDFVTRLTKINLIPEEIGELVKQDLKSKLLWELGGKNVNCNKSHIYSMVETFAEHFEKVASIVDGKVTKEKFIEKFMDGDIGGNKELIDRLFLTSTGDGVNFVDLATRLTKINLVPGEIDKLVKEDLKAKLFLEHCGNNNCDKSQVDFMIETFAKGFEKISSIVDGKITKEQCIENFLNGDVGNNKELVDKLFLTSAGDGLSFVDLITRLTKISMDLAMKLGDAYRK